MLEFGGLPLVRFINVGFALLFEFVGIAAELYRRWHEPFRHAGRFHVSERFDDPVPVARGKGRGRRRRQRCREQDRGQRGSRFQQLVGDGFFLGRHRSPFLCAFH